jgi:hypothetical protein
MGFGRQEKNKLKRFTLYIPLELYGFYCDLAYSQDISVSAVITRILRDHRKNVSAQGAGNGHKTAERATKSPEIRSNPVIHHPEIG